jgi:hypothetical protein
MLVDCFGKKKYTQLFWFVKADGDMATYDELFVVQAIYVTIARWAVEAKREDDANRRQENMTQRSLQFAQLRAQILPSFKENIFICRREAYALQYYALNS